MDVFGKALSDYYQSGKADKLWLHNNYGQPEEMPVEVFFRERDDLTEMEQTALNMCKGKVLDIGAGAGALSLILQKKGLLVDALEISHAACEIMRSKGVTHVINSDIFQYQGGQYDTLLLLMNGIGLCGDVDGLNNFFRKIKELIKPEGQLIFDSSDIAYLYEDLKMPESYYGELSYQYEYQSVKGDLFKWLYVDFSRLTGLAHQNGWHCELIVEDDMDQYLARLTLN